MELTRRQVLESKIYELERDLWHAVTLENSLAIEQIKIAIDNTKKELEKEG